MSGTPRAWRSPGGWWPCRTSSPKASRPGVLDSWGLGYEALRAIKPDIIYVQQSGMGAQGTYGRFRTVGPIANAFAGLSEMSGLPEPAMPAGWGYSYLDWMGAYSFALAMLSALFHRARTGEGQWIDASQSEVGLFISGTTLLDWSANGRIWSRYGNRSPYKPAAPHGVYPCLGEDRWLAIACFTEAEWRALTEVAGHPEWAAGRQVRHSRRAAGAPGCPRCPGRRVDAVPGGLSGDVPPAAGRRASGGLSDSRGPLRP